MYKLLSAALSLALISVSNAVLAAPNVIITANPDPVLPGERLRYRIVIANPAGGGALEDLRLALPIPEGTEIDSNDPLPVPTGGCTSSRCFPTSDALVWDFGTLASGESVVVDVPALSNAGNAGGMVITGQAVVTHDGAGDPTVAEAFATVQVEPALRMAMAADPGPAAPGETLAYTVDIGNRSNASVLDTELRVRVPAGTTVLEASHGGTQDGGDLVWDTGTVPSGDRIQRRFRLRVGAGAGNGTVLVSRARLAQAGERAAVAEVASAVRGGFPLAMEVTANPDPVRTGELLRYQIVVSNRAASGQLENVLLHLPVPTATEIDSNDPLPSPTGGCNSSRCFDNNVPLRWALGTLAAGESVTVQVPAQAFNRPDGTLITARPRAGFTGAPAPALAQRTVAVEDEPALRMTLDADPGPVAPGEALAYTIDIGNRGDASVLDTELRVRLPAGAMVLEASHGGTQAGGALVWDTGTVPFGDRLQRRFRLQIDAAAGDGSVLPARARLNQAGNPALLARAGAATAVRDGYPLALEVTANPDPVRPSERLRYDIVVSNRAASRQLEDVVLHLPVPTGSEIDSNDPLPVPAGGCNSSRCFDDNVPLRWALGTLAAGESVTVQVPDLAFNLPDGTLITARPRVEFIGTPATALAQSTVVVEEEPALRMTLGADPGPVAPGEALAYTIDIGNRGDASVLDTALRVRLPAGATVLEASHGGTQAGGALVWDTGTVPFGDRLQRRFRLQVDAAAGDGSVLLARARLNQAGNPALLVRAGAASAVRDGYPLVLEVTANPDPVRPSERLRYDIVVSNRAASGQLEDVVLHLPVPTGSEIDSNDPLPVPAGGCNSSRCFDGNVPLRWALGTLAAGESVTVQVPDLAFNLPDGTLVTARPRAEFIGIPATAVAQSTVAVEAEPALRMVIAADPGPVGPGEALAYTIDIGNRSNASVLNSGLRVRLPEGMVATAISDGGTQIGDEVAWNTGTIGFGERIQRRFRLPVGAAAAGGRVLLSTARLNRAGSPPLLAGAGVATAVRDAFPLSMTVSANPDPVRPSGFLQYTIELRNTASSGQLEDVLLHLPVPAGTEIDSNDPVPPPTGGCSSSRCFNGTVPLRWAFGTLRAGETATVQIPVLVFGGTPDGTLVTAHPRAGFIGAPATGFLRSTVGSDADFAVDTDGDGVSDADEIEVHGTDPNRADSDGDGLGDGVELGVIGFDSDPSTTTDPLDPDTDNDGRLDGNNGIDPCEDCNNNGRVDAGETSALVENLKAPCPDYQLEAGLNIISHPLPPQDLGCFQVLEFLGASTARLLQRFTDTTGRFESCTLTVPDGGGAPVLAGEDFPIEAGVGYLLFANQDASTTLPGCQ